jgi:hypothetical protein
METLHTLIAQKAILEYFDKKSTKQIENESVPNELNQRKACFVTLKTSDNALRGCIGTLEPRYDNLYSEIIKNSISSAFFDYRFSPLTKKEFQTISISVEVLSPLESVSGPQHLNPKVYGAVISDASGKRGVLLPDIEGVDTVAEQIRIIKRKAGIIQDNNDGLSFFRFTTEKFS